MEEDVKRRLEELEGKVNAAQVAQLLFEKQIKSQFLKDLPCQRMGTVDPIEFEIWWK